MQEVTQRMEELPSNKVTEPSPVQQLSGFSAKRIPELDGVRGLAIVLVLLWHYVQNNLVAAASSPLGYLRHSLFFTWSGVDLFFVLSGFLITGILIDNRNKEHYFKVFFIRRICRIFPLYYLYLLVFILMLYAGAGKLPLFGDSLNLNGVPIWSYATYTQNIFMGLKNTAGADWLIVTWSLAVEEQFYLMLPFLVYFNQKKHLPYLFLWLVLTAIYMRFTMPGISAYINMFWRADSLMTGALLAWAIRRQSFVAWLAPRRLVVLALLVLFAAGILLANQYGRLKVGGGLTHASLAVFYGLFILYVFMYREGLVARIMRGRVLAWLGSISYGIYLLHNNILKILHGLIHHDKPQLLTGSDALVTILALAITLLLAQLSFSLFEKRITRFGHKYKYE